MHIRTCVRRSSLLSCMTDICTCRIAVVKEVYIYTHTHTCFPAATARNAALFSLPWRAIHARCQLVSSGLSIRQCWSRVDSRRRRRVAGRLGDVQPRCIRTSVTEVLSAASRRQLGNLSGNPVSPSGHTLLQLV